MPHGKVNLNKLAVGLKSDILGYMVKMHQAGYIAIELVKCHEWETKVIWQLGLHGHCNSFSSPDLFWSIVLERLKWRRDLQWNTAPHTVTHFFLSPLAIWSSFLCTLSFSLCSWESRTPRAPATSLLATTAVVLGRGALPHGRSSSVGKADFGTKQWTHPKEVS